MTTYTLSIIVEGKDSASGPLGRVSSALGGMGTVMGGILGAGMITAVARQVVEFGKSAISATANMQNMKAGLEALVARELKQKDASLEMTQALNLAAPASARLLTNIKKLAITSPYQLGTVQDTFKLAMAFGFAGDEAMSFTRGVLNMSAGIGASDEMMGRMAYNLAQIRLQGKVTAVDVRQLAMAGFDLIGALRGIGAQHGLVINSADEFNKAIEEGKLKWEDFAKDFEKYANDEFGGASARLSKTLSGLGSTFKDFFILTMPTLIGPAAEKVTKFLQGILSTLIDLGDNGTLENWGKTLAANISPGIDSLEGLLTKLGLLGQTNEDMRGRGFVKIDPGSAIREAIDNIDWSLIGESITAFVSRIAKDIKTEIDNIDWDATLSGIAIGVSGFLAGVTGQQGGRFSLAALLGLDDRQIGQINAALEPIIASIGNFADAFMVNVWPALVAIGAAFSASWAVLKPSLTELGNTFVKLLPDNFNTFAEMLPAITAVIVSFIGIVLSVVTGLVNGITIAMQAWMVGAQVVKEGLRNVFNGIYDFFFGFGTMIVSLFTDNGDQLKAGWEQMWTGLGEFAYGAFTTIIGVFATSLAGILGLVYGFIEGVIGYFVNLYDVLVGHSIIPDMMAAIVVSISTGFTSALGSIVKFVTDAIASVSEFATRIGTSISNGVTEVKNAFNSMIDSVIDDMRSRGKDFLARGQGWIAQLINGINGMVDNAVKALEALIEAVLATIVPIVIPVSFGTPTGGNVGGQSTGGGAGSGGAGSGGGTTTIVPQVAGARGLSNFVVPPGFENDSFPVFASSGEVVNIDQPKTYRNSGSGGGGTVINVEVNIEKVDSEIDIYQMAYQIAELIRERQS